MATIPLDEIIPGATIRFTVIDGVQYLSIRDLIMHLCDKDGNDSGQIWRRLQEDKKNEVQTNCLNFKFPGRGQSEQPVITFPGAIKLSMFLPGENAKKNRSIMSKILVRYFAGDPSLIKEIEANAASDAPVAQMARASLASEDEETQLRLARKRQYEQLEYEERVAALERMKAETEMIKANVEKTKTDSYVKQFELYSSLCAPDPLLDERARLMFKDVVMNSIAGPAATGQLQVTDAGAVPAPASPAGFLTISSVASQIGYKFDSSQLKKLGSRIAQAYYRKYNEFPSKHEQFVDGAVRRVNSYQAKDRELMVLEMQRFAADNMLRF